MRSVWWVWLVLLVGTACTGGDASDIARPTQTLAFDPSLAARPTAPAPLNGDFRSDAGARLVLNDRERPRLLVIYSQTCGNCIAMRPALHQLEADYWGRVDFIYLDYGNPNHSNYEVFIAYDIRGVPELVLLNRYNQLVYRWRGAPAIDDLRRILDRL